MGDWDPRAFEEGLIADMRAHNGEITQGPLAGRPILVMTSTGAKTGQSRRAILTFSRDGDAYVVAGTANGSPKDPAWIKNLEANSNVTVEAEGRTVDARAELARGADRDRLWDRHVAERPEFADYPEQAGRTIPMARLTPIS